MRAPFGFLFELDLRRRGLIILSVASQILHSIIHHWSARRPSLVLFIVSSFILASLLIPLFPQSAILPYLMCIHFLIRHFGLVWFLEVPLTYNIILVSDVRHNYMIFICCETITTVSLVNILRVSQLKKNYFSCKSF